MADRHIAQKAPYPVDVEAGKTYYWRAADNPRSNRSAMARTRRPASRPSHGRRKQPAKKPISAAANARKTNPSAMAATPSCDTFDIRLAQVALS